MIKLDADKRKLIIDLQYKAGRNLADMVIESIFLYVATCSEDKAIVRQLSSMIKGEQPMVDIDLMDYTNKDKLC